MGLICRDVMVPSHTQKTIHPDASVSQALDIIKACRARFLPAVDDTGKYVGMFSAPTLLKLIMPTAATINFSSDDSRLKLDNLSFLNLTREDLDKRVEQLKNEKVGDNLSRPEKIPVTAPDTPLMEGIFLIHKFKRHLVLVEPDTGRFVGTVSANSVLDNVIS